MKILMVCLGNICRSPMAEGIMRQKLAEHQVEALVDSCGTANYHVGEQPDVRAITKAKQYGINISTHLGRQFGVADFDAFDRIYVMDPSNYIHVLRLARNEKDKAKVKLILDEMYPGQNKSVPDPYYGGDEGFEEVYALLNTVCDTICVNLKSN